MQEKKASKKLVIGWFSFSCCEDSTIMMTELLNDHQEWFKLIDFKYVKILRKKRELGPMDVAFIEGAIASDEQEAEVKKIRSFATKVVAIGSCAVTGMPSAQRNSFSEETKREIAELLQKFKFGDKVKKLEEVITIDAKVPGCPMNTDLFFTAVNTMLREFKIS